MMGLLVEQQHLEDCFRLSQMFMHDSQWVEFADAHGYMQQKQVAAADLVWDVDIWMESDASIDAAQVEAAMLMLQAGAQIPGVGEEVDFVKIMLEMMGRMGFTNAQRFRRPPQEIQARQQEGQQREMAMAAIQAQLQGEVAASKGGAAGGNPDDGSGGGAAGGGGEGSAQPAGAAA
jgi:hypothetical protein